MPLLNIPGLQSSESRVNERKFGSFSKGIAKSQRFKLVYSSLSLYVNFSRVGYVPQLKKKLLNHTDGSAVGPGSDCPSTEMYILRIVGVVIAFAKRETCGGDQKTKCTRNVFR